ncbi:MAG: restriction endonuclease subunit S [Methanobrevibacter sp.]|nr:restriction endonuclease subunit S [Methanobrevibacter sp.]
MKFLILAHSLRFAGFTDEWDSGKFDDLFNFQVAGDMKKELFNEELNDEFKYPLYANALENDGVLGYYKEYKYNPNTITVTARGNIGHATVRKNKFNAIGRLIMLTAKDDLNMDFFAEYINSNVKVHIENTGVPQLTAPSLKINKLNYPNLNEQNKISDFLIMLNKKIALLEKKHLKYQDFKKYLMQQIFAQKLRFDYDIVKLKDIAKINKGKQLNKDAMIEDGEYYVLNGGKEPSGYTNSWNTPENTITISEGGNSCGYVNFNEEKFWSGGHCYYLSNLDNNVNDYYLYSYLKFKEEFIMRLRVGSGLPNIQKGDIENFKIQIVSEDNQIKISNLLLSSDKKINSIKIQKENIENFKKGLLQQMFVYILMQTILNFCAKICCIKYFLKSKYALNFFSSNSILLSTKVRKLAIFSCSL